MDLRDAWRNLLRRPGFSALAVLTLAVGVGVNTIAFSAVNALLFHPFTFAGVDRLGWVMLSTPGNPYGDLSWAEFRQIERSAASFDAVAGEGRATLALGADGHAEQIFSLLVSRDYFRAVGARAEAGRLLDATDAASPHLAGVVSHRFWRERLNGAAIAGLTLVVNKRAVSIVGVMPDAFQGPGGLYAPDLWLPLDRIEVLDLPRRLTGGGDRWITVVGRLASGVTVAAAQGELAALAAQFAAAQPPRRADGGAGQMTVRFHPMREGHPEVQGLGRFVWVAMAIVGVVLLIACFNVAALLLARASERQREIAIRTALGASRLRIVRQLVTEGLFFAACSGVASLLAASWSGRLLAAFALPAPTPQRLHMEIDGRLVAFTAGAVLVAGIFPALLPALQATRRQLTASMRPDTTASGGRRARARNALVMTQIAGSTLFLATALLFVRSFLAASAFDPGFDVEHAVVATIDPAQYGVEGAQARRLIDDVLRRLDDSPAIAAASAADRVPFSVGYPKKEIVSAPGESCAPGACRPVTAYAILPRHFAALGVRLVAGRDLTDLEARTDTAVIVSEALARTRWPNASAVGQSLRLGPQGRVVQVVGVTADTRHYNVREPAAPVIYRPLRDDDLATGVTLVVRAAGDPRSAVLALRDALHSAAPSVPIASVQAMSERLELPLWPYRTAAGFFLVCGGLALLLAMVGLFGVTYFAVRQRTREFGVRVAVGATTGDVVRQVLREGLGLTVPAAALGLAAAIIVGRLAARALVGVSPTDLISLAGAGAIEATVALLACVLPARRAAAADPIVALREN